LVLAISATPLTSATINVDGSCTLPRAIIAANIDSTFGGCPAGNGADRIVLLSGSTQTLSVVNNNYYGRMHSSRLF
jgi:hypothetical protein